MNKRKSIINLKLNIDQFVSIINSFSLLDNFTKRKIHEDIIFSLKNKIRKNKLQSILYKVNSINNNFIRKKYFSVWKSQSEINNTNNENIKTNIHINTNKYEKLLNIIKIMELGISIKLKYYFINKLKNIRHYKEIQIKNEEISYLRNNNIILNYRIKDLEVNNNKEINNNKDINNIKELKERIEYLEKMSKKDYIITLMDKIIKRDEEIKELKSKIPFDLSNEEKLMSVIFISSKRI